MSIFVARNNTTVFHDEQDYNNIFGDAAGILTDVVDSGTG